MSNLQIVMEEDQIVNEVGFTVDSGLVSRLGIELVGKAETAVSELIKNSYDADATEVSVEFLKVPTLFSSARAFFV